jgi:hypothetical protein
MNPLFSRNGRRAKGATIGVSFIPAVLLCIFLILFVISNAHWIPVNIPSAPWNATPVLFAFETPLIAALSVAFFLGCAVTFFIWRAIYRQSIRKQGMLRRHVTSLENTLEKTQRLISTTQTDNESSNPGTRQE